MNSKKWPLALGFLGMALVAAGATVSAWDLGADGKSSPNSSKFSYLMVPPDHPHMRRLLDNAFGYLNPAHGILDTKSGYPAEGWNQEPQNGLFLRSFTQLTAIGVWADLLANIAAGFADNPYISKDAALDGLAHLIGSLLSDQHNPALAAKGLLVNFISLDGPDRVGPLGESVDRSQFVEAFGDAEGNRIWQALVAKGWLKEQDAGRSGRVLRADAYGAAHFDGPLTPWSQPDIAARIMGLLDRRSVTIVFGDNANLTAALARGIGALLGPSVRDNPRAAALREQMERFIEAQREGYAHLYDPATGNFVFGWDALADRFMGWDDGQGHWVSGRMNYLINEFRGPWTFLILRYGLPHTALANAGLKVKPYPLPDGRDTYALAAWDGSAFELLGLSLFMQEPQNPGWRQNLERLAAIELDYSGRYGLPGLLSEAYSGEGTEYTGKIGIPELAISDHPLNTRSPSLYSLGVAYGIAPDQVEGFLAAHWPLISGLFTDHGPWEGWNAARSSAIRYQTTAHTLSLILGGIGTAQDNMRRYLEDHRLVTDLARLYAPGDPLNLLADEVRKRPRASKASPADLSCSEDGCRLRTHLAGAVGVTFVPPQGRTASLSNGRLMIRYSSESDLPLASIAFKRAKDDPRPPLTIPVELHPRFERTQAGEMEILLPATPALAGIAEIDLAFGADREQSPMDLTLRELRFVPFDAALDRQR